MLIHSDILIKAEDVFLEESVKWNHVSTITWVTIYILF